MNGNEAHENRVSFLSINVCLLLGFCGFLITKRMEVLGLSIYFLTNLFLRIFLYYERKGVVVAFIRLIF